MFELLGFWFSVTLIVGFLLSWTIYVVPFVVDIWVYYITGKEVKHLLWKKYPEEVRNLLMWDEDFPNLFIFIPCLMGFFLLIRASVKGHEDNIYTEVSNLATLMTPFMSWIAIVLLMFVGFTWVSKKAYVLSKKVSAITKKLEEEK